RGWTCRRRWGRRGPPSRRGGWRRRRRRRGSGGRAGRRCCRGGSPRGSSHIGGGSATASDALARAGRTERGVLNGSSGTAGRRRLLRPAPAISTGRRPPLGSCCRKRSAAAASWVHSRLAQRALDGGQLFDAQGFAAPGGVDAGALQRGGELLRRGEAGGGAHGVEQRLAALGEGGLHHPAEALLAPHLRARAGEAAEADHRGLHLGRRVEEVRRDTEELLHVEVVL